MTQGFVVHLLFFIIIYNALMCISYTGEESEAEKLKHSEIVTWPPSASKFLK